MAPIYCAHKPVAIIVLISFLLAVSSFAGPWRCPCGGETFNFDPRDQGYKTSWIQIHMAAHCAGSGKSTAQTGGGSTVAQSLSPLVQNLFNTIGRIIATNRIEKERLEELRRQEDERLLQEARERAAQRRQKQLELHYRLLAELKFLGDRGDLQLKGFGTGGLKLKRLDDEGSDLKPRGTAFFGLGGDAGSKRGPDDPTAEPPPVNLQNLRRAAFLAEKAAQSTTEDAAALLDEAIAVADGQPSFVAIDDNAAPVVSEEGLKAFQQANIDYRRARADHIQASDRFVQAERDVRVSCEVMSVANAKGNQPSAAAIEQIPNIPGQLIPELTAAFKAFQQQLAKARHELEQAQSDVSFLNFIRRRILLSFFVNQL